MGLTLIIYTSNYPYTKSSESFLAPELVYARQYFSRVIVVPVNKDSYCRQVPEGIEIDNAIALRSFFRIIRAILALFSIRTLKGVNLKHPWSFLLFKDGIKYLFAANLVYDDLKKRLTIINEDVCLYSYWLSYAPIAFSWIKSRFPQKKITMISRAHGHDVYTTDVGVYIPKREMSLPALDAIFTVSDYGKSYLVNRYPGLNNIITSHLGVADNRPVPIKRDPSVIRVVSCSNLIPLKRVDLLFEELNYYAGTHPNTQLHWNHIGDGPLMKNLQELIKERNNNFYVDFLGTLDNSRIMELYRTTYFDCYLLLSESEGIPVSIMESLSSGIPVIATNVGGVSEIVNNRTGVLLSKYFTKEEFENALDYILNNNLRESSYNFFLEEYEAKKNFSEFYSKVIKVCNN